MIWSQHHILLDGWCLPIVLGDVLKTYEALLQGKEASLSTRRPFRDYIAWLQHQDIQEAEKFWKETLHGLEGPTRLSFKDLINPASEKDYDTYHTVLSEEDTENLRQFAQDHGLTLNTLLQGAVGAVLKTYTRQEEIVLGVTVSGRSIDLPGIEDMVGLFINTLPLRITFNPEETLLSSLHTLQKSTQKLNDYAYASLAQIQSWSGINQSLFDVLFVFENYPLDEGVKSSNCGFKIKDVKGIEKTEYPLTIAVMPGKQLSLMLSYQTEHFNEELIQSLSEHIKQILIGILNSSKEEALIPLQELPLLTSQEKHQLLIEWNDTEVDYPADKIVHQLFEEQVRKTPHNIAVVYEDQELNYEQLNEKANQLAHYLRAQGIGPDTLVAIAVERSLEMIIGLLAILKAGGAYVPLDPTYPEDRLQFMLEDTKAPLLITQTHLKEKFKDYAGKALSLQLDTETKDLLIEEAPLNELGLSSQVWTHLSTRDSQDLPPLSTPLNLAYIIYTSGSTGKPKGVENTHQAFLNRINWTLKNYSLSEKDSLLYIASIGFDISVWEMLFPLSGGARVIIAGEDQAKDILAISSLIQAHKVTTLHFVPSLLNLFIHSKEGKECTSLKQMITGGEALLNEVRRDFIDTFKSTNLYLAYGPTEAAISVTHWNCREQGYLTKTPIGTPISNTQLYVLDEGLNPVPVGVSGELYIGGVGLARGYLNRSDLTAERFIPNPFVNEAKIQARSSQTNLSLLPSSESLRLYRTGDLARYLPDGNIEFLGRIDDQVKIRGFRIELGEIESTLASHGDVSQVVVMAREDEPGNKKLVAYVVPENTKASSLLLQETFSSSAQEAFSILTGESLPAFTEELRNHLARSLPEYMVPSFFVYIDKIPLTSNGKIDRKSLPAPDLSLRTIGEEYVAPQSDLEQSLAAIWSEVLKVENIGVHDNFFKIGGDSIISIQLVAKARQQGIHFNVKDIFTYPTVASLASVARTQEDVLTLKPDQNSVKGEISLTPIQSWFFDQDLKEVNHFNQAVLLKAQESLDPSLLTQALKLLISHHDALRFRYSKQPSQSWKQECLEGENISSDLLRVFDFSQTLDTDLAARIEEEASLLQQSLHIETGPLIKAALFDCGAQRPARLFMAIHHLVIDGVSWRILLEDLERIYTQLAQGNVPTLLPKTHSYQQWAQGLKEYASSEDLVQEVSYWKTIEEQINSLPVDFNKGIADGLSLSTLAVSLTAEETTDLLQKVPGAYRTQINDILLTALLLAIGDWKGTYDLALSLEGHGREDIVKDIDLSSSYDALTQSVILHLKF